MKVEIFALGGFGRGSIDFGSIFMQFYACITGTDSFRY